MGCRDLSAPFRSRNRWENVLSRIKIDPQVPGQGVRAHRSDEDASMNHPGLFVLPIILLLIAVEQPGARGLSHAHPRMAVVESAPPDAYQSVPRGHARKLDPVARRTPL